MLCINGVPYAHMQRRSQYIGAVWGSVCESTLTHLELMPCPNHVDSFAVKGVRYCKLVAGQLCFEYGDSSGPLLRLDEVLPFFARVAGMRVYALDFEARADGCLFETQTRTWVADPDGTCTDRGVDAWSETFDYPSQACEYVYMDVVGPHPGDFAPADFDDTKVSSFAIRALDSWRCPSLGDSLPQLDKPEKVQKKKQSRDKKILKEADWLYSGGAFFDAITSLEEWLQNNKPSAGVALALHRYNAVLGDWSACKKAALVLAKVPGRTSQARIMLKDALKRLDELNVDEQAMLLIPSTG